MSSMTSSDDRTPEIRAFITRFIESDAGSGASSKDLVIDAFGDGESARLADDLLELVLAGTKTATVETGAEIQVPLFVEQGTRVKVDTRDGSYLGRVN